MTTALLASSTIGYIFSMHYGHALSIPNKSNPKVFLCLRFIKSNNATLFHQFTLFERFLAVVHECNINVHYILQLLTCALIFPIDVLQVKAIMALADVTPKCVDAPTETGTNRMACGTFIHICTTNTPIHHFSTLFQAPVWIKVKRSQ